MKLNIKQCTKCGAKVEVLQDCSCKNCGIKCCGQEMQEIIPNTVDCAVEKHLPQVEIVGNYIVVTVNHVMEKEHFIEWIGLVGEGVSAKKYFYANEIAKAVFPYIKGSTVYSYCNKHGLWQTEIK